MTLYFAFWGAGCFVALIIACVILRSRGALDAAALMALAAGSVGFVYGAKVQFRLRYLPFDEAFVVPLDQAFSPGFHIPLGLALSGVFLIAACLLMRAPWRTVGDALAVGAAVMMPIGRLGCFLSGCCGGIVCGTWASPICLSFPPGSEIYSIQVNAGVINPDAALSLPVHPLQLYFGAVGLAIFCIQIWILRRGFPAGSNIAAFHFFYPLAQLALEHIRASYPDQSHSVMTTVLVSTIVADVTCVGIAVAIWAFRQRAARRVAGAAVAVLLAFVISTPAHAQEQEAQPFDAASQKAWTRALGRYANRPVANRRRLFALARHGTENVPPIYLVALADAYLRSGDYPSATEVFTAVLQTNPGQPIAGWSHLGLGWIKVRTEDFPGARLEFARASEMGTATGVLATLMTALLDAADGRVRESLATFEQVVANGEATPSLRMAAKVGIGYGRYWTGDDTGAVTAFEAAILDDPDGRVSDDAYYGIARARWHAGDIAAARKLLREMIERKNVKTVAVPVSDEMLNLEPGSIVRTGFVRYRRLPLRPPEDQILELLDNDGTRLARAALRRIEGDPEVPQIASIPAAAPIPVTQAVAAPSAPVPRAAAVPVEVPRPQVHHEPRGRGPVFWWLCALTVALLGGLVISGMLGDRGEQTRRR